MVQPALIPELFFDLIARAIPGFFLVVGLVVAVPGWREAMHNPASYKVFPPYASVPVIVIGCYIIGSILQVVSERLLLIGQLKFEVTCSLLSRDAKTNSGRQNLLNKPTTDLLKTRVVQLFGLTLEELDFYRCFDYVRLHTGNGNTVVKCFAEASCACGITLASMLVILPALWLNEPRWLALLITAIFALASFQVMKRRRKRAILRLLLSLLQ